jgi:ligand-binding sensor domain-containing protein/DNA-binding CsgD family transcriptional regulator
MLYHLKKLIFSVLIIGIAQSQELPPVQSFYPETYNAGDQNWAITQDDSKRIYIANNKGLLSYDGSKWQLNPTPNESIMRSVLAVGNRVYSGQYRDFGFWERNKFGELLYTSLLEKFNLTALEDEEFWGIEVLGDWLMFQSLDRIYVLNEKTSKVNIIESETSLTELVLFEDTVIFQKVDQGIFKLENGQEELITNHKELISAILVDAYKKEGHWYVLTRGKGLFKISDTGISKPDTPINRAIETKSIYSAIHLDNGYYALGSISNGLLLFDASEEFLYSINQTNGLSNNTVLAVFNDIDGNIWLAMDNGISLINQNSPFKVYYDQTGVLGTVYTAVEYENTLFLGTNQGLFFKNDNKIFDMVEGTEGQVWSLDIINNELFCGHDRGTFLISKSRKANRISNIQGTWKVKPIPNQSNLLIQGNYNGLYVLHKENNQWSVRNKIQGFDTSTRYFEFSGANEILVSHEYKGIYIVELSEDLTRLKTIEKDSTKVNVNSSLINYQGSILFTSQQGIYKYQDATKKFLRDSVLSQLMTYAPYVSGKLLKTDASNKLWYISKDGLSYAKPDDLSGDISFKHLFLPLEKRSTKSGYEHLFQLSEHSYLLGTTEGYMILDEIADEEISPQISIDKIYITTVGEKPNLIDRHTETEFKYNTNYLNFSFYAPYYKILSNPHFRYRLKGYYDEWSDWSDYSNVTFENLSHGNYVFEVQSKLGNSVSDRAASYAFTIQKPWYLSNSAFILYALVLIFIGIVVHVLYRAYYQNQKRQLMLASEKEIEIKELEAEKKLMHFKNENLQLDVENKSRELGLSTMNLIQKNQLLNDIKSQLSNVKSLSEIKQVIKLINRNLNTSADWKVFEEAFNNADKDFLKNVKLKHPSLTSHDLRLCAYLRLNLSSKEIAPLLNISHKSVEVKRYRLRKKMDLPREINLTDYILGM